MFVQVLFTPIRHHQHWRWLIKLPVLPFTITRLRRRKMFTCQAVWFVRKRVGKKMKMSFSLILRLFVIWVWKKMNLRGRGKIFFFSQIFYWHWFRNLCGFFFLKKKMISRLYKLKKSGFFFLIYFLIFIFLINKLKVKTMLFWVNEMNFWSMKWIFGEVKGYVLCYLLYLGKWILVT